MTQGRVAWIMIASSADSQNAAGRKRMVMSSTAVRRCQKASVRCHISHRTVNANKVIIDTFTAKPNQSRGRQKAGTPEIAYTVTLRPIKPIPTMTPAICQRRLAV